MITGLANLGPSQMVGSVKADKTEKASNFDQILNTKSDKDVRATLTSKDPVPVEKILQKLKNDNAETDVKSSSIDKPRMAPKEKEESGRDELESVKSKKVSEKSGKKSKDSSQTREQVMLQFMDSMESEFSIPPVRIAEAMANLSDSDSVSSPEDSAQQVISQLNLPTDQEQKAYALYMGMLAQLKQADQQVTKTPAPAFIATAAVPVDMLSSKERRNQLNSSLDKMNQNFFMKTATAPNAGQALPVEKSTDLLSPKTQDMMPAQGNELPQTYSAQNLNAHQMMNPQRPTAQALGQEELGDQASFEDQLAAGMEKIDPKSPEGQKLVKALAALGAAAASLESSVPTEATPTAQPMNLNAMNKSMKDQGFGEEKDKGDSGSSKGDHSFFSTHASQAANHTTRAETAQAAPPTFAGAMTAAVGGDQQDSQANIQQIMKQAQYMIKKGGGESKIQMNPEGLGEIHMKVVVNEGKVDLQMTTDNKETKKLIESSLGDLKTNLGQHKLSVDQVRVDVGNQTSNENRNSESQSQQRQMDLRQDQSQNQQRNQARDFWSQFQDGNNDRRAAFNESPAIRAYGGSRSMDPLNPDSAAASEKRYSGSGKGRGIDLVA